MIKFPNDFPFVSSQFIIHSANHVQIPFLSSDYGDTCCELIDLRNWLPLVRKDVISFARSLNFSVNIATSHVYRILEVGDSMLLSFSNHWRFFDTYTRAKVNNKAIIPYYPTIFRVIFSQFWCTNYVNLILIYLTDFGLCKLPSIGENMSSIWVKFLKPIFKFVNLEVFPFEALFV